MNRYLLIDNYSGYIIADTGDAASRVYQVDDPITLCRQMASRVGGTVARVSDLGPHDKGVRVYLANEIGRYYDARDTHLIETIEQECPLVMTVRFE